MSSVTDRRLLRALDYQGVELADSPHRRQLDEVCETFAALSGDSLLYPFRLRRGFPAPGTPLRGWYGEGLFNNLGQFLTLYARLHAATSDRRFADKAVALMRGWAETIDENGYFFNSTAAGTKEYSFDKMVCGLLDIHQYVGDGDALSLLRRITSWMLRFGDRSRPYAWNGSGPLEWYTLSEQLYRAFAVTGDPVYRELGDRYFYDEFYAAIRDRDHEALMRSAEAVHNFYQAHSHLNSLNGAAARYELTGEPEHLDTIVAGYEFMHETQTYATGMFGPLESFVKPGQLGEVIHSEVAHAEVSCPSWAMMRLVRHLIELTGAARYGDWMELNLYNGIGAAPPTRADGRAMQYFADYGLTGARKTWGLEWSCCSTTNPISIAEYANQIYYVGPAALYVCLYLPSTVTHRFDEATLRLTQRTAFPASESVDFQIELDRPVTATIALRIPAWVSRPAEIRVEGEPLDVPVHDGWANLTREWRDGERITLTLPMRLDVIPVAPEHDGGPVALRYGPVVLVVPETEGSRALGLEDVPHIVNTLERPDPSSLAFTGTAVDGRLVDLVPYANVEPGTPYAMHIDDDHGRIRHDNLEFDRPEDWEQVNIQEFILTKRRTYAASEVPGASFRAAFEGTGVLWCGYLSPLAGYADIWIDGEFVERIIQLGRSELPAFMWSQPGLEPGRHELRVVVSGEAPVASRGTEVNVVHIRGVQ